MKEDISSRDVPDVSQREFDNRVFEPTEFEDGMVALLQHYLSDCPGIRVVSYMDYRKDTDTADPLVVCASGDLQVDPSQSGHVSTGFGLNAYPGSTDNKIRYSSTLLAPFKIRCLARTARENRQTAYQVFTILCAIAPFLSETFDIKDFRVQSMSGTSKVKGDSDDNLWATEIQCMYRSELALAIERVSPRLKSFGFDLNPTIL